MLSGTVLYIQSKHYRMLECPLSISFASPQHRLLNQLIHCYRMLIHWQIKDEYELLCIS